MPALKWTGRTGLGLESFFPCANKMRASQEESFFGKPSGQCRLRPFTGEIMSSFLTGVLNLSQTYAYNHKKVFQREILTQIKSKPFTRNFPCITSSSAAVFLLLPVRAMSRAGAVSNKPWIKGSAEGSSGFLYPSKLKFASCLRPTFAEAL